MKNKKIKLITILIFSILLPTITFSKETNENISTISTVSNLFNQPNKKFNNDDFFGINENSIPIFKVDVKNDSKKSNKMCITFDSAYINKYTYQILDILDEYNIKSTFFMTRGFMLKNKEQVIEILKRGHEIGNHSVSHPNFKEITEQQMIKQIKYVDDTLYEIANVHTNLFRFPYGAYNKTALNVVKDLGYYPIQWSFDSIDWRNQGAEYLINRFILNDDRLIPGAIILFHNGADGTVEALPTIINQIYSKGLSLCRVSDLIYENNFYIDSKGTQTSKATSSNIQK